MSFDNNNNLSNIFVDEFYMNLKLVFLLKLAIFNV